MKTIGKIIYNSYSEEVNETVDAFIAEAEKHDFSADSYLSGVLATLKKENARLTTAIRASKASSEKSYFDEQRDLAGKGLFFCANAACLLPNEEVLKPALVIQKLLDRYTPSIFKANYDKETAFINSLLEDLAALETEVNAVPQLGLHVEHLKQTQNNFIKARNQYTDAKIEEKTLLSAYQQRQVVRKWMNDKVIPYLNLMDTFNAEVYGTVVAKCAELVAENNIRVKRRLAASAKTDEA